MHYYYTLPERRHVPSERFERPVEWHHFWHRRGRGQRGHSFQLTTRNRRLVGVNHVKQPVKRSLVGKQLYCVDHQGPPEMLL